MAVFKMKRINIRPKFTVFIVFICIFIAYSAFAQIEAMSPLAYPYLAAIKARIAQIAADSALFAQEAAQQEESVVLKLCIIRDGTLNRVEIEESSGKEAWDNLAANIAQQAFPFTPFPTGIREPKLWVEVPVILNKKRKEVSVTLSSATTLEEKPHLSSQTPAQVASQLRLEGYVRIAMANHQPSRIAKEQTKLAFLKIQEAERRLYPTFSAEYRASSGKTITDPYESLSYGFESEQLLLGLNQILDSVKREKIGLDMAKDNYSRLQNDVRYEVSRAFYDLIGKQMLLKHWQEASGETKGDLEMMQRLYAAGLTVATDFENVQSQQKLIEHQVSSVEADVSLAKLSLAQAMNLDTSDVDLLEAPSDFGFPAQDLKLDFGSAAKTGLQNRPEIKIWQKTSESSFIQEAINRRENIPKLSLKTSYGRSGEAFSTQQLRLVDNWSLMGKLTWLFGPNSMELSQTEDKTLPKNITDTVTKTEASSTDLKFSLLDRLDYYSAKKEAQITYQQSLSELNETRKKVVYEVKESFLAYKKALSAMQSSLNRMEYKKNELKVIKARVGAGEGSPPELVEAKVNLSNDKAGYLRALGEYYLAVAALEKATGYSLGKFI